MSSKKGYSRYFIILQEDEKGYGLASDKLPTGYVKLETKNGKCKISFYVQNLKGEGKPYHMMLICSKKDTKAVIKLDELNIDDSGKAETCLEYPIDNIGNYNMTVDKVTGAAIVKVSGSVIAAPMSGFVTTDIPLEWKTYPLIDIQNKRGEEENKEQTVEESNIFEKYEEGIEKVKEESDRKEENEQDLIIEVKADENREECKLDIEYNSEEDRNERNIISASKQKGTKAAPVETPKAVSPEQAAPEAAPPEQMVPEATAPEQVMPEAAVPKTTTPEVTIPETVAPEEMQSEQKIPEEIISGLKIDELKITEEEESIFEEKKECKQDMPMGTLGEFFKKLAEGFEEITGVCDGIKTCKWYKVPVRYLNNMYDISDYNKYTIVYYPMLGYYPYIRNHGHYILGYKCDKEGNMKYLVYGIPGTKSIMDQPFGGKSGFVTWIPSKKVTNYGDQLGYWLMFYDFKTSNIVVPKKKNH
ncbi:MAG: hypothetical protein Q8936_03740 [Bacillota bacterium]|nr:hypothetical protein [Bacillota bacterium]